MSYFQIQTGPVLAPCSDLKDQKSAVVLGLPASLFINHPFNAAPTTTMLELNSIGDIQIARLPTHGPQILQSEFCRFEMFDNAEGKFLTQDRPSPYPKPELIREFPRNSAKFRI
ncbi:MAG: hypothetical protein CMM35_08610 [Rhodospirillaceae bacterium]|nr:hypothetical protein [Rhodospirillaceae bacterium]